MFTPKSLAVLCAVVVTASAAAQTTPEPVRATLRDPQLDALVAEALAKAPETTAAQASVEAAQRRVVPARTIADPFVSTTYQNEGRNPSFGSEAGSFVGIMASQSIPWRGKLRLAGDVAASEAREIERGALGRTALTLESRVRNAWYDVVLARALDRILDERRNTLTQIEASARERYAAGLAVQQDVLRAQIELARTDEQKAALGALLVSRVAELNRLAAAPQDREVATPDRLPADASIPALADLITSSAARNPELAAAMQGIETGRIRTELARKNFLPDFTVNAGSMYRGSFEMGPMWQVGVGVSIPLWVERRQQNQLAEAEAVVRGRTAESEVVMRELELRTRERAAQLDAVLRIAALYRDKVLPLDEVSFESALASYQAGRLPFLSVLDAMNALYGDRAAYEGRLAEAAKWRVAIDEASLAPTAMSGVSAPMGGTTMSETRNQTAETRSTSAASSGMGGM